MMAKRVLFYSALLLLSSPVMGQQHQPAQEYYFLNSDEYQFWKDRIKAINQETMLLQCEKDFIYNQGTTNHPIPCMVKGSGNKIEVISPRKESNGYPILLMPNLANYHDDAYFAPSLTYYSSIKRIPPITRKEIIHVLSIIKELAPELYVALKRVDPDGSSHILRLYVNGINVSVEVSKKDGFPIFSVTPEFLRMSIAKQRFFLGHELGHYVLNHGLARCNYAVTHPRFSEEQETERQIYKGKRRVKGP